jgi:hypothetical protein
MIEKKLVKRAGGNDLNELKGSFLFWRFYENGKK